MSKLVLFVEQIEELQDGSNQLLSCTLRDELSFSRRIGEPIIIANVAPIFAKGYFALGILRGFSNGPAGDTLAQVEIRLFPGTIAFTETAPDRARIAEVADDQYERIISSAVGAGGAEEESGQDRFSVSINDFSEQLRRQQGGRCSFSGIPTHDGVAHIIRPPQHGGIWHASNFIFLDPEPGKLFTAFAWTLGPKLEILINASAVVAGLAETVPTGGKLALSTAILARPDADAIEWHRAQFLARLRKEEQR